MHLHMQDGFHPADGSSFHTTFITASFAVKISGRVDAFASFLRLLHMLLWKNIFVGFNLYLSESQILFGK